MKLKSFVLLLLICAVSLTACVQQDNSVSILFVGDTYFGETYQEKLEFNILEEGGYNYSLYNFISILQDSDLVIANLETSVTYLKESLYEGEKDYIHRSNPPQTLQALQDHNIMNFALANNHALDFGPQGLEQTSGSLKLYGMEGFGAGKNINSAGEPLLKDFGPAGSMAVISAYELNDKYDDVYFYYAEEQGGGVYPLSVERISRQIEELRLQNPDMFIVIFPHWGTNYSPVLENQKEIAHSLIDAGADLIIGHGAHMVQDMENYNGKWIVYSIGNFVFNSPGRYQKYEVDPYSYIARLLLDEGGVKLYLYPIFTDNQVTNYQSRFVTGPEFEEIFSKYGNEDLFRDRDKYGYYMEAVL